MMPGFKNIKKFLLYRFFLLHLSVVICDNRSFVDKTKFKRHSYIFLCSVPFRNVHQIFYDFFSSFSSLSVFRTAVF
jgi:hypothetical protein